MIRHLASSVYRRAGGGGLPSGKKERKTKNEKQLKY
jgi:hypothetical protein